MFWFLWYNWVTPSNSYTTWTFPGTDRVIGGVFVIDVGAVVLGIVLFVLCRILLPAYFRGEVLNRDTPTRVPEDIGVPVGLFGIDESQAPVAAAVGTEGAPVGKEPDAR
jgi:hypothetical protein